MLTSDHETAYDRRCREIESRWRWQFAWLPLLRWLVPVAAALAPAALTVTADCGNVDAEPLCVAGGEVPAGQDGPGHSGGVDCLPARGEPEADALAARLRAWQPTWRELHEGELAEVATAIVAGCRQIPYPSRERCPALTAALLFRESSWRSNAIGRRGERGLGQLHGAALAGETREAAMDPALNVRLTLAWLRRCSALCRMAGHGEEAAALSLYAGLRCRASNGSRLVLAWERDLRAAGGTP